MPLGSGDDDMGTPGDGEERNGRFPAQLMVRGVSELGLQCVIVLSMLLDLLRPNVGTGTAPLLLSVIGMPSDRKNVKAFSKFGISNFNCRRRIYRSFSTEIKHSADGHGQTDVRSRGYLIAMTGGLKAISTGLAEFERSKPARLFLTTMAYFRTHACNSPRSHDSYNPLAASQRLASVELQKYILGFPRELSPSS